ncbi:MAG: YegS/Rv2252/BmrU family lipid kinase [Actinomycetota bacterium]
MNETVPVLISPEAGRGRADGAAAEVLAALAAHGRDPTDITGTDAAASRAAVARAVREGTDRVIVVGGDGLVHLALQEVAGSEAAIGLVPVGTGNDFARGVDGIPLDDVGSAVEVALGPIAALDAIHTDAGWVASVATAGFAGDVNERANRLRFPKGPSRYTVATMAELPTMRPREVELTIDGETTAMRAAMVAIGNTAWFGGGMQICPDAQPADGRLDVTVVGDVGRIELLRFFRLVFSGRHLDHPKVSTFAGSEVRLASAGLAMWGDGEPIGAAPSTMTATPGALRLATPAGRS